MPLLIYVLALFAFWLGFMMLARVVERRAGGPAWGTWPSAAARWPVQICIVLAYFPWAWVVARTGVGYVIGLGVMLAAFQVGNTLVWAVFFQRSRQRWIAVCVWIVAVASPCSAGVYLISEFAYERALPRTTARQIGEEWWVMAIPGLMFMAPAAMSIACGIGASVVDFFRPSESKPVVVLPFDDSQLRRVAEGMRSNGRAENDSAQ
ncbi:hypothetical protein BH11PLA1_BH11PLA1_21120 [soil metagenome]